MKRTTKRLIAKELKHCFILILSSLLLGLVIWGIYAIVNKPPYITDEQFERYERAEQNRQEAINETWAKSDSAPISYRDLAVDTSIISRRQFRSVVDGLRIGSTKYDERYLEDYTHHSPSYKELNINRKDEYKEDLKDKLVHCLVYLPLVVLLLRWLYLAFVALLQFIKKYGK